MSRTDYNKGKTCDFFLYPDLYRLYIEMWNELNLNITILKIYRIVLYQFELSLMYFISRNDIIYL